MTFDRAFTNNNAFARDELERERIEVETRVEKERGHAAHTTVQLIALSSSAAAAGVVNCWETTERERGRKRGREEETENRVQQGFARVR